MLRTLLNYFYRIFLFKINKNVVLNGKLKVKNKPIINVIKGSFLEIGDNVTLNQKIHFNVNMLP